MTDLDIIGAFTYNRLRNPRRWCVLCAVMTSFPFCFYSLGAYGPRETTSPSFLDFNIDRDIPDNIGARLSSLDRFLCNVLCTERLAPKSGVGLDEWILNQGTGKWQEMMTKSENQM